MPKGRDVCMARIHEKDSRAERRCVGSSLCMYLVSLLALLCNVFKVETYEWTNAIYCV